MSDNNQTNAIKIERIFDAPIEAVWQMWTDPEKFASWYGPMGATIPVAEMDVTPRGKRRGCMAMETPGGPMQMWLGGVYTEIVEPRRLVYTEAMSDPDGNVMDPAATGMGDGPAFTEIIIELEPIDGRTKMLLIHAGVPADSPAAGGWNSAFDKLAPLVAG